MATPIEEAIKCPICGLTGTLGAKMRTAKPGIQAAVCICNNERCRWYKTGWTIQFNPDGSIPDARTRTQDDREDRRFPRDDNVLFEQRAAAVRAQADKANREADGQT